MSYGQLPIASQPFISVEITDRKYMPSQEDPEVPIFSISSSETVTVSNKPILIPTGITKLYLSPGYWAEFRASSHLLERHLLPTTTILDTEVPINIGVINLAPAIDSEIPKGVHLGDIVVYSCKNIKCMRIIN